MMVDDVEDEADELADEVVFGDGKDVVVERRKRVTVGKTTTVAVDIRTPGDRCQPERDTPSGKSLTAHINTFISRYATASPRASRTTCVPIQAAHYLFRACLSFATAPNIPKLTPGYQLTSLSYRAAAVGPIDCRAAQSITRTLELAPAQRR